MAAISNTLFTFLEPGKRVVSVDTSGVTGSMFFNQNKNFGMVVIINGSCTAEQYIVGLRTISYRAINSLYDDLVK